MARRAVDVELKLAVALADPRSVGMSVTALCAELGIGRDTYYEARRRFAAAGPAGLLPSSRRPHHSPNQVPAATEDAIVRVRKQLAEEGWDNGAVSIRFRLLDEGLVPPAVSTIHRVLRRRGLIIDEPAKRPHAADRRFEYPDRNGCWQMDGTHWKLADGTEVCIIGVIDDHTRRARHWAAVSENGEDVWAAFLYAVNEFGLPAQVLTDNGVAFNASRRGWVVEFTRNLQGLGIRAVSSSNHHPQTCGKRERLNGTVKRWLRRRPRARTLTELQAQLDEFDRAYEQRPHQGLNGQTPAQRWAQAPTAVPGQPAEPATRIATLRVDGRGCIWMPPRYTVAVGRAWTGATLTVITQGQQAAIFNGNQLIRRLDIDPDRAYQPNGLPPGGRRQRRLALSGNK